MLDVAGALLRPCNELIYRVSLAGRRGSGLDPVAPGALGGNSHVYRCAVAGTSGSFEPTWPLDVNQTVADGAATWQEAGFVSDAYVIENSHHGTLLSPYSRQVGGHLYSTPPATEAAASADLVDNSGGTAGGTIADDHRHCQCWQRRRRPTKDAVAYPAAKVNDCLAPRRLIAS